MTMTSHKPYLIRATYDWIVDNGLTPYLLVNAEFPNVQVPEEHIKNGHIVLDVSPKACRGLHMENDRIVFTARFSGNPTQVFIVPAAVLAIYAKENGKGMEFAQEDDDSSPPPAAGPEKSGRSKPSLKVVK